jgi:hypothetical protein
MAKRTTKMPFVIYHPRDASVVLGRFNRVNISSLSLDDVADSLDIPDKDNKGRVVPVSERMQSQAIFLADRLARYSDLGEQRAYNISWRVLNGESKLDELYLRMWNYSITRGLRIDKRLTQAAAKKDILVELFEEFRPGQKQDLSYPAFLEKIKKKDETAIKQGKPVSSRGNIGLRYDAYIGTIFKGVFRGAEKVAKLYGLIK